jgi:hypothetical protein
VRPPARAARPRRPGRAVEAAQLGHAPDVLAEQLGELLVRRVDAVALGPVALRARELLDARGDVDGQSHEARLVVDGPAQRLLDPQRRVGRELEALAVVELLHGADQADRALLDEVEQRQPLALVALGDRDDEAQVRGHHPLLGHQVAALDALGQRDLVLAGQQRGLADVGEEPGEHRAVLGLAVPCRGGHARQHRRRSSGDLHDFLKGT